MAIKCGVIVPRSYCPRRQNTCWTVHKNIARCSRRHHMIPSRTQTARIVRTTTTPRKTGTKKIQMIQAKGLSQVRTTTTQTIARMMRTYVIHRKIKTNKNTIGSTWEDARRNNRVTNNWTTFTTLSHPSMTQTAMIDECSKLSPFSITQWSVSN